MRREDRIRLQHMLDAAKQAQQFILGRERQDLDHDRQLLFAVIRCIEIIGEAVSKVSSDTQAKHRAIPWAEMRGMRNRLIHAYFDINVRLVWDTVTDDLPPPISQLLLGAK